MVMEQIIPDEITIQLENKWITQVINGTSIRSINFADKSVKYVGRKASASTATGNLNKHLAQQKEILEKILKD